MDVENTVNVMKDEQERKKVIVALDHYYEEIINTVSEHQVASPMRAILCGGLGSTAGPVRDIIPPPQFDK